MHIQYFYPEDQSLAERCSLQLKLPISSSGSEGELCLVVKKGHVFVADSMSGEQILELNFNRESLNKKLSENTSAAHPFKKALGRPLKGLVVLDGTGGFLEDALLAASWGVKVFVCERSKILHYLVERALKKASESQRVHHFKKSILEYRHADFLTLLKERKSEIHVLYLDPMYPEKKKKALSAKKHRVLKDLVGTDADFEEKFEQALTLFSGRIVLKRPLKAEILLPKYRVNSFKGKSTRYDLYLRVK